MSQNPPGTCLGHIALSWKQCFYFLLIMRYNITWICSLQLNTLFIYRYLNCTASSWGKHTIKLNQLIVEAQLSVEIAHYAVFVLQNKTVQMLLTDLSMWNCKSFERLFSTTERCYHCVWLMYLSASDRQTGLSDLSAVISSVWLELVGFCEWFFFCF